MSVKAIADGLVALGEKIQRLFDSGKQAGQKAEYDRFWDEYQEEGRRKMYIFGFAFVRWNDATFNPKYDLILSDGYSGQAMFQNNGVTNIKAALERQGVRLDTSAVQYVGNMFQTCSSTELPIIDISSANISTQYCFAFSKIVSIDEVIFSDKTNIASTIFSGATALKNIVIGGEICTSISFKDCPLTAESAKSVISALKDYSGTDNEYTYTVTFSPSTISLLDTEGATAPGGVTWLAYIGSLGWNV